MIVLSIDPASSTGYALIAIKDRVATIYEYGCLTVDLSSEYQGDHCIDLMQQLESIIYLHSVDNICIEDYFFSKRFCNGTNVNAAFRTAIHILARHLGIPYTILNITSWKTYVAGRSTPTKEQKKRWGKELSKKLYIQQALWEGYGFKFPNHILSERTGKPIVFKHDIVDAVAQGVYFCEMILKVKKTVMSVIPPDDVVFKKMSNKIFIYDS